MTPDLLLELTLGVLAVAFLYSTVGHAGASGYIAVMALLGLAPDVIKPAALLLNVLVAAIASYQFWRAGHFSWRLFWPFALGALPAAFVGGALQLPAPALRIMIGIVLLTSAARFLLRPADATNVRPPSPQAALGVGAGLGVLAGLTGTGGGIFLTPLLILMRWADARGAAAVSAPFILGNSVAGLAGHFTAAQSLPAVAWPLTAAVVIGGSAGSWLGSQRFAPHTIKRFLAAVLTVAGAKLILTA